MSCSTRLELHFINTLIFNIQYFYFVVEQRMFSATYDALMHLFLHVFYKFRSSPNMYHQKRKVKLHYLENLSNVNISNKTMTNDMNEIFPKSEAIITLEMQQLQISGKLKNYKSQNLPVVPHIHTMCKSQME